MRIGVNEVSWFMCGIGWELILSAIGFIETLSVCVFRMVALGLGMVDKGGM